MLSSVINEGVRGLQNSQREMVKSANEIARATVPANAAPGVPTTSVPGETTLAPISESLEARPSASSVSEPLIELRRQEQLFDASAKVISVADKTIGSLLDVTT